MERGVVEALEGTYGECCVESHLWAVARGSVGSSRWCGNLRDLRNFPFSDLVLVDFTKGEWIRVGLSGVGSARSSGKGVVVVRLAVGREAGVVCGVLAVWGGLGGGRCARAVSFAALGACLAFGCDVVLLQYVQANERVRRPATERAGPAGALLRAQLRRGRAT